MTLLLMVDAACVKLNFQNHMVFLIDNYVLHSQII